MKSSICKTGRDHTSFEYEELDGERGFQIDLMRNDFLETRWVTYDDDGAWLVYSSHWKIVNGKKRTLQERDLTPEDIHMIETLVQEALA